MRRSPLLVLLVVLALAGLATGCGTSGGEEADQPTKATADSTTTNVDDQSTDDDPTTTAGDDDGDDDGPASVSTEDLKAILPTLDDLGDPAYTDEEVQVGQDEDEGDDDDSDAQFEEACPGISELEFFDDTASDDDSVAVTFSADDEREVEVRLDPSSSSLTPDNIDKAIEALNGCDDVTISDDDGSETTVSFHAERDDTYGDHGLRLEMEATVSYMGMDIDVEFLGQAFLADGIGVFVNASSGFEESDTSLIGDAVPLDAEHVDAMSELMEERVGSL